MKIDDLPAPERGWFRFLEGMIADQTDDLGRRDQAFDEAARSAVSDLQRARFELERQRVKLLAGQATEQGAAALRQGMEHLQGQKTGYDFARSYAIALNLLGRKSDAVAVLQRQLQSLPPEEKQVLDDLRLLLGLIAGPEKRGGAQRALRAARPGREPRIAARRAAAPGPGQRQTAPRARSSARNWTS